ncbi:hypothetical protein ISN45_Aa05g006250 [Arabidopsis thaliana x Arabidopsis arenosa]|uniref:Protein THYLAKOID ASSEMBLY 8, chloroplastic n=1 Tax=Arabidopsis thaliana x Arabidopsis arenosa TaxID=1240361 RepID=A0A8T1ZI99_9BRAS|nr:hypothetical protein ISN45_Aa05g006250 [Arabidopsis thaliana x Arabidopsis arenosa]
MALSLSQTRPPSLTLNLSVVVPKRRLVSIRCGPRDNRGPLLKGRILSTEAIQSIQSLKRAHRTGSSISLTLRPLRRLIKSDLVSVLRELLRQDYCTLAVHVLSTLRSEYPPLDLVLYADIVNALSRNKEFDEIDRLIGEIELIDQRSDDKALAKLIRAVVGAERRESVVRVYTLMRESGWGSESWEADEYVAEVLSKGLLRLGEQDLASQVSLKSSILNP